MVLNHEMIDRLISDGKLKIQNYDKTSLSPASYDAHLGKKAFVSSEKAKIDVEAKGNLLLQAGDFAVVSTYERFEFPLDLVGHIGIRSHYARKGIIQLSGPQIDPGFCGVLVVGLFNSSPRDIIIPYKEPLLTIEFVRLIEPAKKGYCGPYQEQEDIPTADMEWLVETKGMSFAQVITNLQALSMNVKSLSDSVVTFREDLKSFKTTVTVGLAILTLIVAAFGFLGYFLR
jgi:dCTP deaminase